jgi:hypothetical protein
MKNNNSISEVINSEYPPCNFTTNHPYLNGLPQLVFLEMNDTKVMRDPKLFKKATELGYIVSEIQGGLVIHGNNTSKINKLVFFLQQRTKDLISIYSI